MGYENSFCRLESGRVSHPDPQLPLFLKNGQIHLLHRERAVIERSKAGFN